MQISTITEIISQFIGLFHLDEDPDRAWWHPDGGGNQSQLYVEPSSFPALGHTPSDEPATYTAPAPLATIPVTSDTILHAWRGSLVAIPHAQTVPHGPLDLFQQQPPIVDSGAGSNGSGDASSGASPIWHGADETVADVHQVNMLNGDTSYVDNPTGGPLPIPSAAPITAMIDQAYAAIPVSAPVLGQSDTVEVQAIKGFEDALGLGSAPQADALTQGTWADGVKTSSDGSPVPLSLPVQNLNLSTPTGADVPLGQTIITGRDVAGNAALVSDASGSHLTTIVEGNAYNADLIIQSNVVQNLDTIATNLPGAFGANTPMNGDVATNTAHFEQLPVTSIASGHFGDQWNVQVNNGDFYDINATTQQNVLLNDTLYVGASTTDHYYVELGGNTQINQFQISHDAPVYDLLIVLGNSYSANAIYQQNVLLNDTTVGVTFSANGGADTIAAGHNTASNDAAIAESGTTSWSQPTANLQSLVHSLTSHGDAAAAFPGIPSAGTTVNVMIVTGNYYNINLISQTNIVANSSNVLADLSKASLGTPANVVTGQDTLSNSAAIVSAGALNSQYVAGHHYETSMLVQANLVTANADVSAGSPNALVPELVAFLNTGDPQADPSHGPALPTSEAPHHDVLAGGLA